MKKVGVPQSGKLGDVVASKNHSGPYHRKHSPPKTKPTAAQDYTQGEFRVVAKAWGELTDEQYRAWRARARREKSKSKLGKRWTLTAGSAALSNSAGSVPWPPRTRTWPVARSVAEW